MNLSPTAQATLLLTSYFGKAGNEDARPLTNSEWGRFALWLKEKTISPADLLTLNPQPLLDGWHDSRVSVERILQLLGRGHSLALAVEKWQRAGLWVVTRSDPEYPKRLKLRLKTDSPPVLFGCGNKFLLDAGGLAVIGSRNASDNDLSFTQQIGEKAAAEGIAVVSGGARGVDEVAMLAAINGGGPVIGIMADSLLKAATSAKWRRGLMDGHLVLISPFYPEAGFSAGNAMARNKYIYCLADSSLVIHSGKTGGTLNGAEENLKKNWVPLWVKPTLDKDAANTDLVSKGGCWYETDIQSQNIQILLAAEKHLDSKSNEQPDMFAIPNSSKTLQEELFGTKPVSEESSLQIVNPKEKQSIQPDGISHEPVNFYQVFVEELSKFANAPVTIEELIEKSGLNKSQVSDWLKRALEEGVVIKLNRPIRYQLSSNPQTIRLVKNG